MGLPCGVEEQQVSVLVDLQRSMCVGAPEGVGRVDGGGGQSLWHGHPHVNTGQMHHYRLRERKRTEGDVSRGEPAVPLLAT